MAEPQRVVDPLLEPFRRRAEGAGVFCDFDGTLSRIVADPATAEPVEGVPELLSELARRYHRVAVISGRPVAFLEALLPDTVILSGLYGIEVSHRGRRHHHPSAGAWREVIDDVAAVSRSMGPPGTRVESKGLSLTLHYREHPELVDEVREWAVRQAARSGLDLRPARMSFELHPPIPADKGTAVLQLTEGLDASLYIGDDVGDLRAFDALDELKLKGVTVVRVAVQSDEAPSELLDRADLVVDGPDGVVAVLEHLR